jgi:hypothetical protein
MFLMKPLNLTISIFAGLLGGFLGQHVFPFTPVYAQADPRAPKTVEAGAFRLVSPASHLAGSMTINKNGDGVITLFDAEGKAIFTSEEKAIAKPALAK